MKHDAQFESYSQIAAFNQIKSVMAPDSPPTPMNSNSPEVLQLLADGLEQILKRYLDHDPIYVLVIASDGLCNCISNAPVQKADQLRDIFKELSTREPHLHN